MVVYCDSVILMYFFDYLGPFNARATARLGALAAAKDNIAVSELVRLEYRIIPIRNADKTKLAVFDAFCIRPDVRMTPITKDVFDRAALIRATYNYKLGDSLHLAAAVEAGYERFLTNDHRLLGFMDIVVEVLP